MNEKQPVALTYASLLCKEADSDKFIKYSTARRAAVELRRLHGLNFELLETLRNISECSTDACAIDCARAAIAYATGE